MISVQFGILGDPLAQSVILWNAWISVQLGVSGDPLAQSVQLGNTTTMTTEEGDGFDLCRQGVIHELNKNCDVMKLVTNSLVKCHKQAVAGAGETTQLSPNTLVDGRYTHSDVSDMLLLLFPVHIYIIVVGVIKASRKQIVKISVAHVQVSVGFVSQVIVTHMQDSVDFVCQVFVPHVQDSVGFVCLVSSLCYSHSS